MAHPFDMTLIDGKTVAKIKADNPSLALQTSLQAYLDHRDGATKNPPTMFLHPHDGPERSAVLLAATPDAMGVKVVNSFPANVAKGKARANAVIVLSDLDTGQPYSIMDGTLISLWRTAASAALGARWLADPANPPRTAAVVGTGPIAAGVCDMLRTDGWDLESIGCHDLDRSRAGAFRDSLCAEWDVEVAVLPTLDAALQADMVIFTTSATVPFVQPPHAFRGGQLILNVSLRDIGPELLLAAENVVDDVDHCLKAQTSPHLAEQLIGDRRFITGTLADVITGKAKIDHSKPVIFSPFGMGILDVALAHAVWKQAVADQRAIDMSGFMGDAA